MVPITKKHTLVNFTKGNTGRKYIVIHYTGNDADRAESNANYFYRFNRGASAHYFVDATSIFEVVDPADTAWAVGRNFGKNNLFGICTNGNSISIEMCSTNSAISAKTFNNTVDLTKMLMQKYNINAAHVVRHYDVCSKACPGWSGWIPKNETIWVKFKAAISSGTTPEPAPAPADNGLVFTYAAKAGGKILTEVKNLADFAGIRGKKITDIAVKCNKGSIKYRVHVLGGKWLPYVTGYNWKDYNNGYAGNGKPIDAVQIVLSKAGTSVCEYRVSPVKGNYYDWQKNAQKTGGQDGYAGTIGKAIDRLQIH